LLGEGFRRLIDDHAHPVSRPRSAGRDQDLKAQASQPLDERSVEGHGLAAQRQQLSLQGTRLLDVQHGGQYDGG
jgi:hypothetical protein